MSQGAAKVTWREVDISFYLDRVKQGICCIQGVTTRGPTTAKLVKSWTEFKRFFGGFMSTSNFPLVMKRYFDRGGAAYISRILHYDAGVYDAVKATVNLQDGNTLPAPSNVVATEGAAGTLDDDTYNYTVTATNVFGETIGSQIASATTNAGVGAGSVSIEWDSVQDAVGYNIYTDRENAETFEELEADVTSPYVDDGALTPDGLTVVPTLNTALDQEEILQVDAENPGLWGNGVTLTVAVNPVESDKFDLTITYVDADDNDEDYSETYNGLTVDPTDNINYAENRINEKSALVRVTILASTTPMADRNPFPTADESLITGDDGTTPDKDDYIGNQADAFGLYAFDEIGDSMSIGSIFSGTSIINSDIADVINAGNAYAEARGDMVYYSEIPYDIILPTGTDSAVDFRLGSDGTGSTFTHAPFDSSFGSISFGAPKVYDPLTEAIQQIPFVGEMLAVLNYNDRVAGAWFAAAGRRRGQVPNVESLNMNLGTAGRAADLDTLANNQINAFMQRDGGVNLLWGESTLQRIPSALSELHIRRLLIFLRKLVMPLSELFNYEPNDPVTWRSYFRKIDPVLRELTAKRAFYDYVIQADQDAPDVYSGTLNLPAQIDAGEYKCRIFVKPARAIKYLGIEAIITKTSTNIKELLNVDL